MTIVQTEREKLLESAARDSLHLICCADPDGPTFCGLDSRGMEWDQGENCCIVCDDFDMDYCPKFGVCTSPDMGDFDE